MDNRMKEISEQKYSRNMALSLLAGIVLGAVMALAVLWALGIFSPENREKDAAEGTVEAVSETPQETSEAQAEPETVSEAEESAEAEPGVPTASPEPETERTLEQAGINLFFTLNGSWYGEEGYYYQYVATIENTTEERITDWKITVPDFTGCVVDTYWCCEADEENGQLTITPADFNREIWEGGKAEGIGITVLCETEWELTAADIEAETESGSLTGKQGNGAAESREAEEKQSEEPSSETMRTEQTASQGAKGPDIQVGDLLAGYALQEGTPVGEHGRLRVEDGVLVDQSGEPCQLHGVSTHGLAWYPEYVSEETFRTFRNDWNVEVIRLAMYSDEYGGYSSGGDQKELKALIDRGVEYASKLGMYVIIDWHVLGEGDPNIHKEDAIAFFEEVSEKYADYGNVIYEICNEPNGNVSWSDVKRYAEEVIPVIRDNDPYAVILVGTPQWSQLIEKAAGDPIEGYDNIMYTLHFYAATHKDELRRSLENVLKDGLPVFVSECSICDASGSGGIDESSADAWIELLNQYHVSYVAWAVSNKQETAALIDSSCSKLSDWSDSELSDTGRWFKTEFTK